VLWEGATVRNIVGIDEVSAMGAPGEAGVVVLNVPEGSTAARNGFAEGDLILKFGNYGIDTVQDLLNYTSRLKSGQSVELTVLRNYDTVTVRFKK
jgi:S1-C subfamily serine protease